MRVCCWIVLAVLVGEPGWSSTRCTVTFPKPSSRLHKQISQALLSKIPDNHQAKVKIGFLAVCGDWALTDRVVCAPECPEGGYSLLRRAGATWQELYLPEIEDCDVATAQPFEDPQNTCLAETLKEYPQVPPKLLRSVTQRPMPPNSR
jgi:hypothetical protein